VRKLKHATQQDLGGNLSVRQQWLCHTVRVILSGSWRSISPRGLVGLCRQMAERTFKTTDLSVIGQDARDNQRRPLIYFEASEGLESLAKSLNDLGSFLTKIVATGSEYIDCQSG